MATLEKQITDLEKTLRGAEDTTEKEKFTRMALVKQAAQEMSEEEKKEARKAFDESGDETKESKKSTDDKIDTKESKRSVDEKEDKESTDEDETKESKKSQDYDELKKANDELEKKVASLTASTNYLTAKPYIEKMLAARESAGMDNESIQAFRKSLYGKTVDEIKQRYDEDRVLYKQSLVASAQTEDMPFNGQEFNSLVGSDNNEEMTLEALSE